MARMPRSSLIRATFVACLCLVTMPAAASALPGRSVSAKPDRMIKRVDYAGVQHLHYEYGPIDIVPGQNTIEAHINQLKPTGPRLHHALQAQPRLRGDAQGPARRRDPPAPRRLADRTATRPSPPARRRRSLQFPRGYGYHYEPSDRWIMNYMIHNLTPSPTKVYITYDIDFVPDSAAAAKSASRRASRCGWTSPACGPTRSSTRSRARATKGKFTFPDQATAPQKQDIGPAHEWTSPRGHDAGRAPPATCTRAACTTTSPSRATA